MGLELRYVVCKRCSMVTMAPRFSEEALQCFPTQASYCELGQGSVLAGGRGTGQRFTKDTQAAWNGKGPTQKEAHG